MKDKFSAVGLGPRQVLPIFYHYFCSFLSIKDHIKYRLFDDTTK
jgi:hypothetical protein